MILLQDIIRNSAGHCREKPAVKTRFDQLRYAELDALTDRLAGHIEAAGLGRRRGGIVADNSLEYVVAYFSVTKAGGCVVPLSCHQPAARLSEELRASDLGYVITTPRHVGALPAAPGQAGMPGACWVLGEGGRRTDLAWLASGPRRTRRKADPDPGEPALMLPTSGTDGLPKRVLLSHANLLANVSSFLGAAGLHAGDPGLVVLPMTSSGTNTTELLAYLSAGMTIALYPPAPFILGDFCAALGEFKATVTNLTPFILNLMLAKSGEVRPRVQTLRKIFFASAPIPVSQFERLLEAFPGVQFQYGYGLTEASPRCTMLDPSLARAKMGSAGRPIAGVDVRIIDEAGEPLPAGRTGQILVRGPNVMLGYDRQPDRTRAALAGGWLHTGDLGCLDAEGFLYVKGRIKSVIITRGVKVSPEEVEQALAGHELVQDSHVFGVADDLLGERVEARVVPRVGAHPRSPDLKEFLRRRLPAAAVPDRITVVADLGRGQTHKLPRGRPERVVATQVP